MTFSELKGYRFGVVLISVAAAFSKCWFETPEAFWGLMDFTVRDVWMHLQTVFRMALLEFWFIFLLLPLHKKRTKTFIYLNIL